MAAHGVDFAPRARALPFGDYMRDGSNIAVDTKKDVQELAMDVGRDHARFARECERARQAGYRLVVLTEDNSVPDADALYTWTPWGCRRCRMCNPRKPGTCKKYRSKPIQGATVRKILKSMSADYGVRFEFCKKRDAARRICEILGVSFNDSQRDGEPDPDGPSGD